MCGGFVHVHFAFLHAGTMKRTLPLLAAAALVAACENGPTDPAGSCDSPQTVSLARGGSASYERGDCIILPSGSAGDRYRVGVVWPTEDTATTDGSHQATLSVTGLDVLASAPIAAAPEPAAPAVTLPRPVSEGILRDLATLRATQRFHADMRGREAELVGRIGTRGLMPRRPSVARQLAPAAASPAKMTFDTVTANSCQTSAQKKATAVLIYENDDIAVYQDSAQHVSKPVSVALAQKMTDYYTSYAKEMEESYWGTPSDIDGNGKILVLVSPIVGADIAGFVWAGDFFDSSLSVAEGGCPASNEAELVYVAVDIVLAMTGGDYSALSSLAHEVKHVVGLYDRLAASLRANNTNLYNPEWFEEGTAEIAAEMSSRIAWAANGGPSAVAPMTAAAFAAAGVFNEWNYGVVLNLAQATWFLSSQPNALVVTPDDPSATSDIYGSGWLFNRWLGDAYGNTGRTALGDAPFFRAVTDSMSAPGPTQIATMTGKSFDTLLDEFYTAVMLNGTGAPEVGRAFFTYDFVSATGVFSNPNPPGDFPWPITLNGGETPTVSFETAQYAGRIGPSGIRIHDLVSNGTGTGAQLRLDMPAPGRMIVVRLR